MVSSGFTVAAYLASFTLIGGYTWSLVRRLRRAREALRTRPAE